MEAIELDPDSAEAHRALGLLLKEMGDIAEGEASLRRAITLGAVVE